MKLQLLTLIITSSIIPFALNGKQRNEVGLYQTTYNLLFHKIIKVSLIVLYLYADYQPGTRLD